MNPKINYTNCPEKFRDGLERYLQHRLAPGHFLTAVLENNLQEAVGRGDAESLWLLRPLVLFLYNDCPGNSWGSKERVTEWLNGAEV
jgi:hypothetical protein